MNHNNTFHAKIIFSLRTYLYRESEDYNSNALLTPSRKCYISVGLILSVLHFIFIIIVIIIIVIIIIISFMQGIYTHIPETNYVPREYYYYYYYYHRRKN